jgi:transcriptional regulator NrdR family protein
MQCNNCKYPLSDVVYTSPNDDRKDYIERRRQCKKCTFRWTTYEKYREYPEKKTERT